MRSARLTPAVVLVAHGSRDPRAARATYALARAVGPDVHAAFLDHAGPRPLEVLASLRPGRRAVLVPLLLTSAYHGRVDMPAVVEAARSLPVSVMLAEVLGSESLLDSLIGRLSAACVSAGTAVGELDAVVLAAAGTRDAVARQGIVAAAEALGERLGRPCVAAYASGVPPRAGEAVERLRAAGAGRIGVASYFLAPGVLHDASIESAMASGARVAAAPLNDHPDLVRVVRARVRGALGEGLAAAA